MVWNGYFARRWDWSERHKRAVSSSRPALWGSGCFVWTLRMADQQFLDRLRALRRRIKALLIVDGVGVAVSAGLIGVIVAAVVDYLMWLPAVARLIVAVGLCAGFGLTVWVRVVRPIIVRVALGEIAAVLDARFAVLEDRLASAVSFARAPSGASVAMVERVLAQADEAARRLPLDSVIRWRRPALMVAVALVAGGGAAGVAAAAPWFVTTGLQRYVRPFGPAEWPRRVLIEPMTGNAKRPVGGWFEASARVARGRSDSLRAFVHAETDDGRRSSQAMTYDAKGGRYFHSFKDLRQGFRYWFEAGDDSTVDRGGVFEVTVVPRPAVMEAALALTDPPYVASSRSRTVVLQDAPVSVVAGSRARLTVVASKRLVQSQAGRSRVTLTLPGGDRMDMAPADSDEPGRRFIAAFDVKAGGQMTVHLVDENGFDNLGGTTYALAVREDERPHVVIVEPQAVTEVTPSATLGVVISADDDFGVSKVAVETAVDRNQAAEPTVFDLTDRIQSRRTGGRCVASVQWDWDLRPMALKPGEVVTYRASALDNYELGGRRHEPARSAEMRLKVISADQLAHRVRDELMLLKGALRQLLGAQETVSDEVGTIENETDETKGLSDLAREGLMNLVGRQTRLAGRARYLGGRFEKVVKRLDANRSRDADVRGRSRDASRRLASLSAGPMAEAADRLRQGAQVAVPAGQTKSMAEARRRQKAAADELRSLLAGMEQWGDFQDVVRHVQQLLDQQERQTEGTQRLGRRTLGRRPEELSAKLAAELKRQARQQRRLAGDLVRLTENMARLAKAIRSSDAAAAAALDDSGQAAAASRVDGKMNEAADAIARNRMAQAQAAERAAEDGLREMLARLERRQMQQLEALSKRLAGAVEKVQTLLADQKKLLERTKGLGAGQEDAARRDELARRQQGLSRAAGAVADEVAKVERGARPARGIRRAGGRMNRAAGQLGQAQPDKAAEEQQQAVRELAEALETLEKLRAQAEAEMAAKTLAALTDQMKALRDRQAEANKRLDVLAKGRPAGRELSRVELRRLDKLADEQREIAERLEKLRVRVETARVYDWVMRRIGSDMARLAGRFDQRRVDTESTKLAAGILVQLGHLLAGLEQEPPDDAGKKDRFAEGGGGRGGPTKDKPVPTVAELVVLKAMQSEVNRRTQQADLKAQLTEEVTEGQLEDLRELGSEQEQIRALAEQMVRRVRR